jgi:hypothetical protein
MIEPPTPINPKGITMTLTEHPRITDSRSAPDAEFVVESPQDQPQHDRTRKVASWIAIGVALVGLAVLVVRLVGSDDPPQAPAPTAVTDAKDQPGYRSPTITRSLTTGDAKDQPRYRLPATTWSFTTGDAKDQPGYRLPTEQPVPGPGPVDPQRAPSPI